MCLELPSSGVRTFEESIPLPTGTAKEEALYFFLALISLRRLLAEVIETIGFKCESDDTKPIQLRSMSFSDTLQSVTRSTYQLWQSSFAVKF